MDPNGIILIDKPAGISSFGVVGRVRWQLSQAAGKKIKVGHTGTLDPFATGLMILVVGKACKEAGKYSKLDKVYEATIKLGETSTTGDPEGTITPHFSDLQDQILQKDFREPFLERVREVLGEFPGEIEQTPPAFSAIKVNGQRAYKLARANKDFEIPSRKVTIYSLELLEFEYPTLKIRAHVSSGTYIRTLAEDIGAALQTGAYCQQLRRTKIAEWDIKDAGTIESFTVLN